MENGKYQPKIRKRYLRNIKQEKTKNKTRKSKTKNLKQK